MAAVACICSNIHTRSSLPPNCGRLRRGPGDRRRSDGPLVSPAYRGGTSLDAPAGRSRWTGIFANDLCAEDGAGVEIRAVVHHFVVEPLATRDLIRSRIKVKSLNFMRGRTFIQKFLIIDEALSVGDARFRRKSFNRMRKLCRQDRTILLVSHALGSIEKLCDEAIWMDKGEMRMWDEPHAVVDAYTDFLGVRDEEEGDPVTMEDV